MLASQLKVSRTLVHRVWQRHDVQPHRVEKFKLSNDPHFEEKVRDVVGLYLNPPERALVLCVDERARFRRWIARLPFCLYDPACLNGRRTITNATAQPLVRCL